MICIILKTPCARSHQRHEVRSLVGETIIDMKTPDSKNTDEALAYTQAFVDEWKGDELVHPLIAPHAPNTNTEEVMRAILALRKKPSSYYAPCF